MAYTVKYTDQTKDAITVLDKELNISDTSLTLVGKNVHNYGTYIAENFVHLLENYASTVAPINPVEGQVWYKSDEENYYYFNGVEWKHMPGSTIKRFDLLDTAELSHVVTGILDEGNLVAVISTEEFDISVNDPNYSDFDENIVPGRRIRAGVTLRDGMMFHGTATSAQYADLAERYKSDVDYAPGTVVKIGGEAEVTQTTTAFCPDVFGIISTDPAYVMNSLLCSDNTCVAVEVALEGRVPCRVVGPVKKGDRLVASEIPGVARAVTDYEKQESLDWYRQVGRALEDKTTEGEGLVEVVVGAK